MGEFSMVYYNNLLSLGPIALLVIGFGEHARLPYEPALQNPEFLIVVGVGEDNAHSQAGTGFPLALPNPGLGSQPWWCQLQSGAKHTGTCLVSCVIASLVPCNT
jgi:hypothetical protein